MPLTRRVQVYINPAASDALDAIMETLETGQTKAIEAALLGYAEDHGCYPTAIERSADVGTVMDAFTEKYAANLASSQPDTKLDRSTERIEDGEPGGSFVSQWTKVIKETPRAKNPKPLERQQVVSIPKPGKRK